MDVTTTDAAVPDVSQVDLSTLVPHSIVAPPAGDGFFVSITRAARAAMNGHARSRRDVEVGGILLGRTCRTGDRPFLLIDAIIPALAAESRNANVTFTADTWTQIHAALDRDHPGAIIVGWYHTHPRFGIFLSDMDVFIQRHFFDLPHQVAVVIDPVADEEGVFIWQDGVPVRAALHDEASERAIQQKAVPPLTRLEPFAAAMAYARDDDALPAEFMDAFRKRLEERQTPSKSRSRPFVDSLRALRDLITRFNFTQLLALAGLIALVAIIFGCLAYVLLSGSPPSTGEPMNTRTPDRPADVRE